MHENFWSVKDPHPRLGTDKEDSLMTLTGVLYRRLSMCRDGYLKQYVRLHRWRFSL